MEIKTTLVSRTTQLNEKGKGQTKANSSDSKEKIADEKQDQYIPSSNDEKKVIYDKPKVDHATITKLKEESDQAFSNLRRMVEELLRSQGKSFHDLDLIDVEVDEATRIEAQGLIGEGGELSPEKVSDRIVQFAMAISGGDKAKFDELKAAIEEGFKQAASALGGELPEVSQRTYELIMQKLERWRDEE